MTSLIMMRVSTALCAVGFLVAAAVCLTVNVATGLAVFMAVSAFDQVLFYLAELRLPKEGPDEDPAVDGPRDDDWVAYEAMRQIAQARALACARQRGDHSALSLIKAGWVPPIRYYADTVDDMKGAR